MQIFLGNKLHSLGAICCHNVAVPHIRKLHNAGKKRNKARTINLCDRKVWHYVFYGTMWPMTHRPFELGLVVNFLTMLSYELSAATPESLVRRSLTAIQISFWSNSSSRSLKACINRCEVKQSVRHSISTPGT